MERLVRKYEKSFRRAKEELSKWESLQAILLKQYSNAAAILERLPVLANASNYGAMGGFMRMSQDLPASQIESLERLLRAMGTTLCELKRVSKTLEKIWQDGLHLLHAEKLQPSSRQLQQRMGPRLSLQDCTDGLQNLHIMLHNEYSCLTFSKMHFNRVTSLCLIGQWEAYLL